MHRISRMTLRHTTTLLAAGTVASLILTPATAHAGTAPQEPKNAAPAPVSEPVDDGWKISLWSYGWLAGLEGTTGVKGLTSEVDVPFRKILDHLDMTATMNLEAQKGRWGGWIDGMYLKVSAGGNTPDPLLDNVSLTLKQVAAEAAVFYRVWEGERGSFDVYGGARYMRMDGELNLSLSDEGVQDVTETLSARIVDEILTGAKSKAAAVVAANRPKVAAQLADKAQDVLERAGEIADAHPGLITAIKASDRLRAALRNVAEARLDEQVAAVQGQVAAAKAAAKKAVDRAEKQLAKELERAVRDTVPEQVSASADWVDPFVGARFHYDLNDRVYVTAKADVGGFGISSDLTWQVYGALGIHVTDSTTLELGYKHMAVDYTRGGFTNDVATSGVYLALGLKL